MSAFYRRAITVFASFTLAVSPFARASEPAREIASKPADFVSTMEKIVGGVHDVDDLRLVMALNGESEESIASVSKDFISRNHGSKELAPLVLKNDELMIHGRPSGFKIISYTPLNVSFRGHLWAYDRSASMEKNYFSLTDFVSKKNKVSRLSIFISRANAEDNVKGDPYDGVPACAFAGTLIGFFGTALLFAGAVTTSASLATIAIATLVGMVIGGIADQVLASKEAKRRQNVALSLIGRGQYACNASGLRIVMGTGKDKSQIILDRSVVPERYKLIDTDGVALSTDVIPTFARGTIAEVLKDCPANVAKVKSQFAKALERLKGSPTAPAGPTTSGSSKTAT